MVPGSINSTIEEQYGPKLHKWHYWYYNRCSFTVEVKIQAVIDVTVILQRLNAKISRSTVL